MSTDQPDQPDQLDQVDDQLDLPDSTRLLNVNGLDQSRTALLDLLAGLGRVLYVYTPLVRAELYNDARVLAAIRQRVVNQPKLRLHWLLPPARAWRTTCPGLLSLSDRLSSALILRTPNPAETPDRPELGQAFAIADERALLRFSDPRRLIGVYQPKPSDRLKEVLELFRLLWERAHPDPDLQRLGL